MNRTLVPVMLSICICAAASAPGIAQDAVTLEAVLARTGAFLAAFERDSGGIVSDETYRQRAPSGSGGFIARDLRSSVLIIADPLLGWIEFRDITEVDGREVGDRDRRLEHLFLEPRADRIQQARRIVAEGARHNLNAGRYTVQRTINLPLTPLRFIRATAQPRSTFRLEGTRDVDGVRATVVRFEERALPRLIASADNAAATGRYWVEAETGRVLRSELRFETGEPTLRVRSIIRVSYATDEHLKAWMPRSMEEEYYIAGTFLTGSATYSNFRRFTVATSTDIKAP